MKKKGAAKKRFSRQLFEENDKLTKQATMALIDQEKYTVMENPNTRGVDLLVYKEGIYIFNIECERKKVWKTKDFPYPNVQFPERKGKFAKLDKRTIFLMFNEDFSSYLVVKDKDLLSSPLKEIPNKYVYAGELFFQIPLDKVTFNSIQSILDEMGV